MPKLAIYVPKKEMKEIEKWRKTMNFSKVFMAALKREIAEQSRRVRAPKDKVAAAAAHYKKRLSNDAGTLVDLGFRHGADHVLECRLSAETIRQLLSFDGRDSLSAKQADKVYELLGKDAKSLDAACLKLGYDEGSLPAWRRAIYSGYIKGVTDAWSRVCEEINAK